MTSPFVADYVPQPMNEPDRFALIERHNAAVVTETELTLAAQAAHAGAQNALAQIAVAEHAKADPDVVRAYRETAASYNAAHAKALGELRVVRVEIEAMRERMSDDARLITIAAARAEIVGGDGFEFTETGTLTPTSLAAAVAQIRPAYSYGRVERIGDPALPKMLLGVEIETNDLNAYRALQRHLVSRGDSSALAAKLHGF